MTGLRNHGVMSRIRLRLFGEPLATLLQGKTQARQPVEKERRVPFIRSSHSKIPQLGNSKTDVSQHTTGMIFLTASTAESFFYYVKTTYQFDN